MGEAPQPALIMNKIFDGYGMEPTVLDCTPERYHEDRTMLTRSALADFIHSPAGFRGRWIDGTIPMKKQTDAMRLGSAFHAMLFDDLSYAVWAGGRRQGKKWESFCESSAADNLTILTRSQHGSLLGMVDAIKDDETVGPVLAYGNPRREHVIAWTDEATGLRCKAMIDCLAYGRLVYDWKSAADPAPDVWVPQSRRFGSHLQVAHYLEGIAHAYGPASWVYVVVGSDPPHDVWLLEPDPDVIYVGDKQCAKALAGIRQLLDAPAGTPWRHPQAGTIVPYNYPEWYLRENEGD